MKSSIVKIILNLRAIKNQMPLFLYLNDLLPYKDYFTIFEALEYSNKRN